MAGWELTRPRRLRPALARTGPRNIHVMARERRLEALLAGKLVFFEKLRAHAESLGIPVRAYDLAKGAADLPRHPNDLHILVTDRPSFAPATFCATPHYLNGYWYFDELATRHNSTLRLLPFDPASVERSEADALLARLQRKFIGNNRSKFDQSARAPDLPDGLIAVFAQDIHPADQNVVHVELFEMIDAVLASRGERTVYIKPHPLQPEAMRRRLTALADPDKGIQVGEVSIHDILAHAAVTVTQTSAVAFEGFMHGVPAVVCGQTDFHHNCITARSPDRIGQAIEEAMARDWPHGAFLYWHLEQHCLAPRAADFLPRVCARITAKGFDLPPPR